MNPIDLNSKAFDSHFEELSYTFCELIKCRQLLLQEGYVYDMAIEKDYLKLRNRFNELNRKTNQLIKLIKFSNSESVF